MFTFITLCVLIGSIWSSLYYYKKYKKTKEDYDALLTKLNSCTTEKKSDTDLKELKEALSSLQKKYDSLYSYTLQKETTATNTNKKPSLYTTTTIKYSVKEIIERKDDFVGWETDGTLLKLKIKKAVVGDVDYEPRCNYVNKGWNTPEIIEANAQCCTVNVGDAYIQMRAPQKGIVYYEEKSRLTPGDTVLSIETDLEKVDTFEKELIKEKLLQKKRKQDLEKMALQELMDEGEMFPEANKRPPIPKEVVDAVWNRDGGRCVYCGSTENLHLDHIIPFSKGGDTSVENLQLLCQKCNLQKSNKIG